MKQWLKQKLKLYPIIKTKYLREKTTILTQNITIIRLPLNKTYQKLCLFSLKLWHMDQNKSKPPQPKKKKKKALHFFPQSKHFLHGTENQKEKNLKNHRNRKKHFQALFFRKKRYAWTRNSRKQTFIQLGMMEMEMEMEWELDSRRIKCSAISHRERETNVVVLIRSCELVLGLTNKKQKKRHGLRQDNNVKFLFCCKK